MKGKELSLILQSLNMSYAQAAEICRYEKGTIGSWVSRDANVPMDAIKRLRPMWLTLIQKRRNNDRIIEDILQRYL